MKRGFTLIELMVVVGITLLLSGGGIAAYTKFNDRQLIKKQGAALTDLLRLAQNKALTGEKPASGACVGLSLQGYRVRWTGSQFVVEAVCGGQGVEVKQSLTLSPQVSLVSGSQVLFKVLGQGASGGDFCFKGQGGFYKVKVLISGEVVEDGFVGAC